MDLYSNLKIIKPIEIFLLDYSLLLSETRKLYAIELGKLWSTLFFAIKFSKVFWIWAVTCDIFSVMEENRILGFEMRGSEYIIDLYSFRLVT